MDIKKIGENITEARDAYLKKHFQGPPLIRIRKDVDEALHRSGWAFNYDFSDLMCTTERFMGMDVVVIEDGPEFEIPAVKSDE
jgi:hypothetical protein